MVEHRFSSMERYGWSEMNLATEVGEQQQLGIIFACFLFFLLTFADCEAGKIFYGTMVGTVPFNCTGIIVLMWN